ncbi:TetR/AcrR family transcriptional regulator [Nocardia africana]|uniref:TetR/AcrR family transcriptional regulator n=2 Tax=Nocardia africana TaxID=134964 RepID=UPI001C3FA617|nr:TetR/AcrR family transcriptional regulator [Nocardia africana]MCC3315768.1 TetR/AcrR family transcriptional regulator [Nocardia africana]
MPKNEAGGARPAESERNSSVDDTGVRSVQRRRGAALEAALLQAAWEELLAVGYHQLTFEAVAARADTSRTVLYRRWPCRRDLVLAALRHRTPPLPPPAPDTGALRTDVLAVLHRLTLRMTELAPVFDALADERTRDSDLAHYLQDRTQQAGRSAMATVIDRAAQRGELDRASVPARVAVLPVTLVVGDMLLTHRPPSRAAITEVVDQVFLPLIAHYCRFPTTANQRKPSRT